MSEFQACIDQWPVQELGGWRCGCPCHTPQGLCLDAVIRDLEQLATEAGLGIGLARSLFALHRLRVSLRHHLQAETDPCGPGFGWPCAVARVVLGEEGG